MLTPEEIYERRRDFLTAKEIFGWRNGYAAAYAGMNPRDATRLAVREGFPAARKNSDLMYLTDEDIDALFKEYTLAQIGELFDVHTDRAQIHKMEARLARNPVPKYLQEFLDPNLDVDGAFKKIKSNKRKRNNRGRKKWDLKTL